MVSPQRFGMEPCTCTQEQGGQALCALLAVTEGGGPVAEPGHEEQHGPGSGRGERPSSSSSWLSRAFRACFAAPVPAGACGPGAGPAAVLVAVAVVHRCEAHGRQGAPQAQAAAASSGFGSSGRPTSREGAQGQALAPKVRAPRVVVLDVGLAHEAPVIGAMNAMYMQTWWSVVCTRHPPPHMCAQAALAERAKGLGHSMHHTGADGSHACSLHDALLAT